MTYPAYANNADVLARAATVALERGVDSDTSAQHGGGLSGGKSIGDLDHEVCWGTVVGGIASVGLALAWGLVN